MDNGIRFNREPFQSWTQNYQELYAFGATPITGTVDEFYRSNNFGSSWSKVGDLPGQVVGAGGFPNESDQFYVLAGASILVSIDGGANWIDKTGNWGGSTVTIVNCGGVIVPDWTE
jgi:hypothetical protein